MGYVAVGGFGGKTNLFEILKRFLKFETGVGMITDINYIFMTKNKFYKPQIRGSRGS